MPNYYEDFLVYSGGHYSVYFHAEAKCSSDVNDYFEACDEVTQASLLFFVFKPKRERFFCFFFTGKKIIITSAHTKKKQKLDRGELNKAIQIRRQYFNE